MTLCSLDLMGAACAQCAIAGGYFVACDRAVCGRGGGAGVWAGRLRGSYVACHELRRAEPGTCRNQWSAITASSAILSITLQRTQWLGLLICLLACSLTSVAFTGVADSEPAWTTYHRDAQRSGDDPKRPSRSRRRSPGRPSTWGRRSGGNRWCWANGCMWRPWAIMSTRWNRQPAR